MDERALLSLDGEENERAAELAKLLRHKKEQGLGVSQRDLYPELDLREPYSYCIGSIKPTDILPLVNTLIVDLRPLRTPEQFHARYGLGVEQFVRLVEQGRIAVRLRDCYARFEGLDYLDQLLKRRPPPPLSTRYMQLFREDHEVYLEEGKRTCPERPPRGDRWRAEYRDWVAPPTFREAFARKFALVSCYFGSDYAGQIVEDALSTDADPALAYDWLHNFSRFRVYPYMNCLDGLSVLPISDLGLLPRSLRPSQPEPSREAIVDVPYEVGRAFMLNLPLDLPAELEVALHVPPADWITVITELDKALEGAKPTDVAEKCGMAARFARETREEVERMLGRKMAVERTIATISGIGIVGALSEYAPPEWKPILGVASGALLAGRKIVANTTVKFRKKSHVVAWFDFQKHLTSAHR